MANDEDPNKFSAFATVVGGAAGGFVGSSYHAIYVNYTGDRGYSVVGMFIQVIMLVLGVWFMLWTIRKPLLSWFPIAFCIFCFGLAGILL